MIYSYLHENSLLSQQQSEFSARRCAINHLLAMTHNIYRDLQEVPNKEMRAIFLDLWKAFNKAWHYGLLCKLKFNGTSGTILQLIQNCLKDRCVVLNGKCLNWESICGGVPQGLVLVRWSLLYTLMIFSATLRVELSFRQMTFSFSNQPLTSFLSIPATER